MPRGKNSKPLIKGLKITKKGEGVTPKYKGQKAEIELRTVDIANKFAEGYSSDEIMEWIGKTYNLSDERSYRELTRVYKLFKERTKDEIDTLHKRLSSMYLSLYRQAIQENNPVLALKTLELYTNFATNKDIINVNIVQDTQVNLNLNSYSDEDLEKLLLGESVQVIPNND